MNKKKFLEIFQLIEDLEKKSIIQILTQKINECDNIDEIENFIIKNEIFDNNQSHTVRMKKSCFYFFKNRINVHTSQDDLINNGVLDFVHHLLTKKQKIYVFSADNGWILLKNKKNLKQSILEFGDKDIELKIIRINTFL